MIICSLLIILFKFIRIGSIKNILSFSEYSYNIFRTSLIYYIGSDYSFINDLNLSEQCLTQLKSSFYQSDVSISINSYPYYQKLFFDSSHYKNDLSSYYDCINNKIEVYSTNYKIQNFTYLTVLIDDNKSIYDILTTNSGISSYLIGLCFIDKCTTNDYQKIIRKGLLYFNVTNKNKNDDLNKTNINDEENNLKIKVYMNNDNKKSSGFKKFLQYLPFIIILIHIILVIFNSIPIYLYKLFLYVFFCKQNSLLLKKTTKKKNILFLRNNRKRLKDSEKIKERNSSNLSSLPNDNIMKSIELLYDISNNFSSLIELKKQNEITNDGGLSYINGIKGLAMIFFLFGCVYSAIYNSIITNKNTDDFFNHLTDGFFSIFYIGIKYSPKLLLCTSGFSLFYKFLCFLDGKIDDENEIIRQNDNNLVSKKEIKNNESNDMNNSDSTYQIFYKEGKENSSNNDKISKKYIFDFFLMQLHKYVLYLLFLLFILYSLNWIIIEYGTSGPMWNFFNQNIIYSALNIKYFIPLLIGYKIYFISGLSPEKDNILQYFYLIFQEIFYFIITCVIIFVGYKKNKRIDIFLKIIFVVLILFRVIYYFAKGLDNKDYFGYNEYGQFFTSMIYNYSFYIIGIHYGMINYVVQKGYSEKDLIRNNKQYLISSLNVLNVSKKANKKYLNIVIIIGSILLLFNIFIQQIIIFFIKIIKSNDLKRNMEIYKKDFFTQIVMLFDSDIFVILLNLVSLCIYLKGDNLINNFLCHSIWSIFNRFYFSYILLINPIILYILYNTEASIIFNMPNCFLYSFMSSIFVFLITMVVYIAFELPFKKIVRFWLKLNENEYKERLSNIGIAYHNEGNENRFDSATASFSECDEGEEEEDEY